MRRLLALTMLQRGLSVGVYVVATMILARLLTPGQVGIFSLSAAFVSVANMIREFGMTEYLMQDKDLGPARIRAAFGVAITVSWSVGALILLLRHPMAEYYGEPGVASVLAVLSLSFAFLPFATPITALLYRDMAIARVLWIQTIALIIGHVASVAMAFLGMGYMALAWGSVVNSLCMVVILVATRRDGMRYLPTLHGSGPIWRYCTQFTMSGTLEVVAVNIHEFVIGRRFGFAALGLYSRANGLFVQFNQNIARGISRVLLPNFARLARDGAGDLRQQYIDTLRLYSSCIWPMYALVAVLAPEIIDVMFGAQWSASAPLLRLLCVGAAVQTGYAFAGELLGGMGQAAARLRITSLTTPLWATLCVAASFVSLGAIALATAVHAAVVLVLYMRQLRRLVGFTPLDWIKATSASAALAVCVVVPCMLVRAWLRSSVESELLIAALVSAAAGVVWTAVVFLIRHPVAGEVRTVWRTAADRITRQS